MPYWSQGCKILLVGAGITSLGFLSGCTTTKVSIATNPKGANVFVKSIGSGELTSVGQTPLVMKASELEKKQKGMGPLYLELQKEGFVKSTIVVTEVSAANLDIRQDLEPIMSVENVAELNQSIDLLFEAQRLVKASRLDEALKQLEQAQKEYPEFASIYEMKGGIYYLQKKYKDSLDAYLKASKLNWKNSDVRQMVKLLKAKVGDAGAPSDPGAKKGT